MKKNKTPRCPAFMTVFLLFFTVIGCNIEEIGDAVWHFNGLTGPVTASKITGISTTSGNPLHPGGVTSDPDVVFEGGTYKFWFTGNTMIPDYILGTSYAFSANGLLWDDSDCYSSSPPPSINLAIEPGTWDSHGVETPAVIKIGTDWYCYYTGDMDQGFSYALGLATSPDGQNWTRYGTAPLISPTLAWEMPVDSGDPAIGFYGGILEPTVVYDPDEGLYKMWYAALGVKDTVFTWRMGYAESADGLTWVKNTEPVFTVGTAGEWDDTIVSHFEVVIAPERSGFHLLYYGSSKAEENANAMQPGRIGHAFSSDGLTWERNPKNPVISQTAQGSDPYLTAGPCGLIKGNTMYIWYFSAETEADANAFSFNMQRAEFDYAN